MIPLVWLSFDDTPARCRWDQDIVDILCPETSYEHRSCEPNEHGEVIFAPGDGAVFVFAAGENEDKIPRLNRYISQYEWVVLVLTSDEQATFPWWRVTHPNMRIWVQYPHPSKHSNSNLRHFPIGCPSNEVFSNLVPERIQNIDISFLGQVNHRQRDEMVKAFEFCDLDYSISSTAGFAQGLTRDEYLQVVARSKVVLAPSGPTSADSFRTWEALEAGAVPIVDEGPLPDQEGRSVSGYPKGFWQMLVGYSPPFPIVYEGWKSGPTVTGTILNDYPTHNNTCSSWWQKYKRSLRVKMLKDVEEVMSHTGSRPIPKDTVTTQGGSDITVLVPTSPTPNNPSLSHIETTYHSIRERLPHAEILIMLDGVRHEQEDHRSDYEEYQRRLLWLCNHSWTDVVPFRFGDHLHQAEMTRRTLEHVHTPYVLFVEHDTPLMGDIPWELIKRPLTDHAEHEQQLDVVRLYHEAILQPAHSHMHFETFGDFTVTNQWSQRPHLARTSWYRKTIELYFNDNSRTMIEDKLHSDAQNDRQNFRIGIFTPLGNIQRSGHLDARGDDPKYEMVY